MISVIVTGGNNNYGGDFNERLEASIAHNASLLQVRNLDHEWVFVEWRPEPDRPLTSLWLTERFPFVRTVVAPADFHDAICLNPDVKFLEYHAKNIGIRSATGNFIIVTNADIFWSPQIADGLAGGPLDHNTVYRAMRYDIREDVPAFELSHLQDKDNQIRCHEPKPPYYSNAAGDFIGAVRSVFDRCAGHDESIRQARIHGDARLCRQAEHFGCAFELLGDVYHIDHPGSYIRGVTAAHGGEFDYVSKIPYANRSDWGMDGLKRRTIAPNVEQLVFDRQAVERRFPRPQECAPANV